MQSGRAERSKLSTSHSGAGVLSDGLATHGASNFVRYLGSFLCGYDNRYTFATAVPGASIRSGLIGQTALKPDAARRVAKVVQ